MNLKDLVVETLSELGKDVAQESGGHNSGSSSLPSLGSSVPPDGVDYSSPRMDDLSKTASSNTAKASLLASTLAPSAISSPALAHLMQGSPATISHISSSNDKAPPATAANVAHSSTTLKLSPSIQSDIPITSDARDILQNIREKTIVLFEGLRQARSDDVRTKLNLVINYLQFQLCVVEEFLQNDKDSE